jgi:hypothetical protein
VHVSAYELDGYPQPILRGLGRVSTDRNAIALWIYSSQGVRNPDARATAGRVTIAGIAGGRYTVSWWDTTTGKPTSTSETTVAADGVLTLDTPPIALDIAGIAARVQ